MKCLSNSSRSSAILACLVLAGCQASPQARQQAQAEVAKAQACLEAADFKGAIEAGTRAIQLDSGASEAYLCRGTAIRRLRSIGDGDAELAKSLGYDTPDAMMPDLNQAIGLSNKSGAAHLERGRAYAQLLKRDEAMRDFDKAIEFLEHPAIAYAERGDNYRWRDRPEKALADFSKAIELEPETAEFYFMRALCHTSMKNMAAGNADIDKCRELERKVKQKESDGRTAVRKQELEKLLKSEADKAKAEGKKPFVSFTASWCEPCNKLKGSLEHPLMKDAYAGTHIITLDVDDWELAANALGFQAGIVPGFAEISEEGVRTGRSIHGGAWAENIPENMAPVLKKFFHP